MFLVCAAGIAELFQFQLFLHRFFGLVQEIINFLAACALELGIYLFLCLCSHILFLRNESAGSRTPCEQSFHLLYSPFEPEAGIEPATSSLPWKRSATELLWQNQYAYPSSPNRFCNACFIWDRPNPLFKKTSLAFASFLLVNAS